MTKSSPKEITQLLLAWSEGDQAALEKLTPLVYKELYRLARAYMAREKEGHRLPRHPPCLDESLDLLGSQRTTGNGNRECVVELLAPLDACDASHLPESLSADAGVVIDRRPVVLVTEKLPDEVFGPSAGKQVLGVHEDVIQTQQHETPPADILAYLRPGTHQRGCKLTVSVSAHLPRSPDARLRV